MPLPAELELKALKRRVDRQNSQDDDLLLECLEEAFEQAQAPAPLGCGRLLIPNPALAGDEDTADPVEQTVTTRGRRIVLPDARSIAEVLVDGEATTEYETITHADPSKLNLVVGLAIHEPYWRSYCGHGFRGARRRHTITVKGRFGFPKLPVSLRGAIYTLAARKYMERQAQYADQVPVGEGAAVQTYYRQLPPAVKLAFESFALPGAVAPLA